MKTFRNHIAEEVFYWYIIKGNTEKGKVAHVGTERQLKLKIRKPTFPDGHVLLKSRKDLKIGDKWKGSMGVSEELEESTKEYAKSLEKIANDRALKMLTKSERENLKKIADLLAKKEEVELDEKQVRFFTADERDSYVIDEIKKRKLARHTVNATDDHKMKNGKPTFKFPTPSGEMMIHVWLRSMAAPASKDTKAFNYSIEDK